MMLQAMIDGAGNLDPYSSDFKELIDLCYSCRRCVEVCPAGIPIPDLMSYARHAYQNRAGSSALTLGHRIFANYGTFDRLGSLVAPLSNFMLRRVQVRTAMEWLTHIDARARLPPFDGQSFESWFRKQSIRQREKKIVYYIDSYANFNEPKLGRTVFALLDHLGYEVLVPPQRESGMPAIEYGLIEKARRLARYNLRQLSPYAREGIPIVCSSPAATFLLREGYRRIVGEEGDLNDVSKAVTDVAELLCSELEMGNLEFDDQPQGKATYHYCCLSKALSLGQSTMKLLRAAGIECNFVEECCGGAGVWGTFKENYALSSEIASKLRRRLVPNVDVLTESETCRLQVEAHITTQVRFPVEALAQRVRGLQHAR
jgi:glycerol-3-phosphate dehydrogenase subunit C